MDAINSQMSPGFMLAQNHQMSQLEQSKLSQQVNTYNKSINDGRIPHQSLGKDDFLKLLISQLTHQDPTKPLKDTAFIAQMAQFSSLEQMTNMATNFKKMTDVVSASQAVSTLGKGVEIVSAGQSIRGTVEEVTPGQFPQVKVGDRFYDFSEVQKIFPAEAN